ncbi:hypothetical protein HKD37_03G007070 [Glycine soja]
MEDCFQSFFVGKNKVPVNILQFADDTIFFGEGSMDNVKVVKAILGIHACINDEGSNNKDCFPKASSKKNKVPKNILQFADTLFFLGKVQWIMLKLHAILRSYDGFSPRELGYKSQFGAPGQSEEWGQSCHLNCAMLHFPSHEGTTNCHSKKLWGGNLEGKKIAWVAWSQVCASRERGDWELKTSRSLNNALLIKWKWFMLERLAEGYQSHISLTAVAT